MKEREALARINSGKIKNLRPKIFKNDLVFSTNGQTGLIEYSGNTIPIKFNVRTLNGRAFDVRTLNNRTLSMWAFNIGTFNVRTL